MTIQEIWNAIVGYGLTPTALITLIITAILTGLKVVKYQKSTKINAIKAIEDKLMSLSVNKDVRLSLEQLSLRELKKIEKSLTDKLTQTVENLTKDIGDIKDIIKVLAGAVAHLKALPSEQVAELNAILGLTSPATIIELKPIEPMKVNPVEPQSTTDKETDLAELYNPFGR